MLLNATVSFGLADIERRKSKSATVGSLSVKLFSLEFINTAIVTLVVYARLPNNANSGLEQVGVLLCHGALKGGLPLKLDKRSILYTYKLTSL